MELRQFFERYGSICDVYIPHKRHIRADYAFIRFARLDDATAALMENGRIFKERVITVALDRKFAAERVAVVECVGKKKRRRTRRSKSKSAGKHF